MFLIDLTVSYSSVRLTTVWTSQANRSRSRPFRVGELFKHSLNSVVTTNFSVLNHGRACRSRSIRIMHTHATNRIPVRKSGPILTRVVSTYTYAVPLSAISNNNPKFGSKPQEVHGGGCLREEEVHQRSNGFWVQSIESWPIRNRYPPSHTLGSIPSEHGAFALGKAAQTCATHGEANRWGSRIYGDTVSTIQNPNRYRLHSLHTHRELCVCEVVNSQQGGVGVTLCLQWYWYYIDNDGVYIPTNRSFVKFKVKRW